MICLIVCCTFSSTVGSLKWRIHIFFFPRKFLIIQKNEFCSPIPLQEREHNFPRMKTIDFLQLDHCFLSDVSIVSSKRFIISVFIFCCHLTSNSVLTSCVLCCFASTYLTPSVGAVVLYLCISLYSIILPIINLGVLFDRFHIVCEFDVQMTHYGDFILSCPLSSIQFHINSFYYSMYLKIHRLFYHYSI